VQASDPNETLEMYRVMQKKVGATKEVPVLNTTVVGDIAINRRK
jgi:hypothetical protein